VRGQAAQWEPDFDVTVPNAARMYDFLLDGKDHFASDRDAVGKLLEVAPDTPRRARLNRAFMGRAVRYVAGQGVRQFLDVGAGLPTQQNVHQVAQSMAPDARTVYADNDPVVLTHARALLAVDQQTAAVEGDVREPVGILSNPQVRELLDFTRPVCVLLVAILHFVPDSADPAGIVATFRDAIVPGSYLIVSHATAEGAPPQELARTGEVHAVYDRSSTPIIFRGTSQIMPMLEGFSLVEPGLVPIMAWRPEVPASSRFAAFLGAVGRKDEAAG
jgi:S-adenosyl methyltransferase